MDQVVQRHVDIETFKPEPYWVLQVSAETPGDGDASRILSLEWERVRSFDREVAVLFHPTEF